MKSPIANWTPKTSTGWDNARLLKAHTDRKRIKAAKAEQATSNAESKPSTAMRKRQKDAARSREFHVSLFTRQPLPPDEQWEFDIDSGVPLLMPKGSYDASDEEWRLELALAEPEDRITGNCRSGTLRGALKNVREALEHARSVWIMPEHPWLCLWLPTCGMISEARELLQTNPSLAHFSKLFMPATGITARRRGGKEGATRYRSWKQALKHDEPAVHFGCYALIYLDNPKQRLPLYESTLARLYLAGHGVFELNRGVVLQPAVHLVLHHKLTDQPLQRVPRKVFGRTGTHWAFWMDPKVVLDSPAQDNPSARRLNRLGLSCEEKRQYELLKLRTAAPIDPEEDSCHECNHHDLHF